MKSTLKDFMVSADAWKKLKKSFQTMVNYIAAQDAVIQELKAEVTKVLAELEAKRAAESLKDWDWTIPKKWPTKRDEIMPNWPSDWHREIVPSWPGPRLQDYAISHGSGLGLSVPNTSF